MSKTWYGHHIDTIKGDDYVLLKDYLELDKEIEEYKEIEKSLIKECEEKNKEIERLNNMIEEIGKMIEDLLDNCTPDGYTYWAYKTIYGHYLDIKGLKEGKDND